MLLGLGSYDKSIRCWDLRTGETLAAFQHEEPVESMVIGSGSILYSAAGSKIYGWDLVSSTASKSPLFSYTPHQKTITALVYDRKTMSILTGSIDHHVKVIGIDPATGELRTERTFVYGSPILCVVLNVRSLIILTFCRMAATGLLLEWPADKSQLGSERNLPLSLKLQPNRRRELWWKRPLFQNIGKSIPCCAHLITDVR